VDGGLEQVLQEPWQTLAQLEEALDLFQKAKAAGSRGLDGLIQETEALLVERRRARDPLRFRSVM
jgi:hypothetical protein